MRTGRTRTAIKLLDHDHSGATVAPQWRVIGQVTIGEVLLATGETDGAVQALTTAVAAAEAQRLPQQIQRARNAAGSRLHDVARLASEALIRLGGDVRAHTSRD